jgi:hypothetical protein
MTLFSGFLFSLPGCILDINLDPLRDPGPLEDPVDEDRVDLGNETDIDTFDPILDDSIQPEQYDCDITCQDGWSALCSGTENWCVSAFIGDGNCCEAYGMCRDFGAMPGIWPNAGPFDYIVPPDFRLVNPAGAIMISYCGMAGSLVSCNVSCFDANGEKVHGETHAFAISSDCSSEDCLVYTGGTCSGDIGCGTTCRLPVWCWKQ